MIHHIHRRKFVAWAICLLVGCTWAAGQQTQTAPQVPFAQLVQQLSEPGGYFDTDNLISNEKSYLEVIPALEQKAVSGGVYIGVGPDQNFSYIARIRPSMAFIVDIRRDNLLLQLLFKALFANSRTRVEYLSLLTGRAPPDQLDSWREASLDRIIAYVDSATPAPAKARQQVEDTLRRLGVPLSSADLETIRKFHSRFINEGLSLRFNSFGRQPQTYDPYYRDLLLGTDRTGRRLSYLAAETDFQYVRSLQAKDQIVPVVGDVAGPHALAAIAQWMQDHQERLSAFYISNVEDYLFRDGTFEKYVDNLRRLPHDSRTVMIRSVFGRFAWSDSSERPNPSTGSVSTIQDLNTLLTGFAAGKYPTYSDLVHK